ncbi:MAG: hypothetical protein ACLQVD_12500 [Capsulimonadaceae bacterium]
MTKLAAALFAAVVCLATPMRVNADVTITQQTTFDSPGVREMLQDLPESQVSALLGQYSGIATGKPLITTFYLQGKKMRTDIGETTIVQDSASGREFTLNHSTHRYTLSVTVPFHAPPGTYRCTITPIGKTREILGQTVDGYKLDMTTPLMPSCTIDGEIWAAPGLPVPPAAAYNTEMATGLEAGMNKVKGLPLAYNVVYHNTPAGEITVTSTPTTIDRTPLAADIFRIPDDYSPATSATPSTSPPATAPDTPASPPAGGQESGKALRAHPNSTAGSAPDIAGGPGIEAMLSNPKLAQQLFGGATGPGASVSPVAAGGPNLEAMLSDPAVRQMLGGSGGIDPAELQKMLGSGGGAGLQGLLSDPGVRQMLGGGGIDSGGLQSMLATAMGGIDSDAMGSPELDNMLSDPKSLMMLGGDSAIDTGGLEMMLAAAMDREDSGSPGGSGMPNTQALQQLLGGAAGATGPSAAPAKRSGQPANISATPDPSWDQIRAEAQSLFSEDGQ